MNELGRGEEMRGWQTPLHSATTHTNGGSSGKQQAFEVNTINLGLLITHPPTLANKLYAREP